MFDRGSLTAGEAAAGEYGAPVHFELRVGVGALQHLSNEVARRERRGIAVNHQRQARLSQHAQISRVSTDVLEQKADLSLNVCCVARLTRRSHPA